VLLVVQKHDVYSSPDQPPAHGVALLLSSLSTEIAHRLFKHQFCGDCLEYINIHAI